MEKTGLRFLSLATSAFFVAAGCSADLSVPEGAQIGCTTEAECPAGWTCNANLQKCIMTGEIDQTAPVFVGTPAISPPVVKRGAIVRALFDASEELETVPEVVIDLRGALRPFVHDTAKSAGTHYEFTYAVGGDEPEITCQVFATMLDRGGNRTTGASVGGVMFDFTPPGIGTAAVTYGPPPGSAVQAVTRATTGSTISVTILATEILAASEPPVLSAANGATTIEFDVVPGGATAVGAVFRTTVPEGAADGVYVPVVTLSDEAGNRNTAATFAEPTIVVKSSRPALLVDQTQVIFVRSPWGNASEEDRGVQVLPAGPYFALAPSDPLDGPPSIPPGAFALDGDVAPVLVRAWGDAGMTSLLGTAAPGAGGQWPSTRLLNLDVPTVYVTGVDDAGNESDPKKIENVEWVATANPSGYGKSPHTLFATGHAAESRIQNPVAGSGTTTGAEGVDAMSLSVRAEMPWRERVPSAEVGPRIVQSAAYDTGRGVTVMFGGWDGAKLHQDTFEWNGLAWSDRTPAGRKPPVRMSAGLAHDSLRGRTVLFGGFNGLGVYDDTWEWDGSEWTGIKQSGEPPRPRSGHSMAFDSARGRIVVFGGRSDLALLDDLWEWDGDAWVEVAKAGAWPPPRSDAAMAFDAGRGTIMLYGGSDDYGGALGDLWEWEGGGWTRIDAVGPGPLVYHSLVFDQVRERTVLFGGFDGTVFRGDVWEWDGAVWTNPRPGAGPVGRGAHASVFDVGRWVMVIVGGCGAMGSNSECTDTMHDTWGWNGSEWRELTPKNLWPEPRFGQAMAYDGGGQRAVIFGGSSDFMSGIHRDTWAWDGFGWSELDEAESPPPARGGAGMAFDSGRNRLVLFGGCDGFDANLLCSSYRDDTWERDGDAWIDVTPSGPRPSARFAHALAYDSVRGRTMLFGGSPEDGFLDDTWEWDGTSWVERVVAGARPPARDSHVMTFDAARGKTVLFGGWNGGSFLDDLWEWDGNAWSEIPKVGAWPGARGNPTMVYDPERGRIVLFGGDVSGGVVQLQDSWEWDGTQWHDVTPSGLAPAPRAAHGAALDARAGTLLVFGGFSENNILADLWERVGDLQRRPAVQFDVSTEGAGFGPAAISQIRMRAFAGGVSTPFDATAAGATLLGWSTGGPGLPPGSWQALATNNAPAGESEPYLPEPETTVLSWASRDAAEARRFMTERDRRISVQLRPSGPTGSGAREAAVAVDYVEVRVRYQAR